MWIWRYPRGLFCGGFMKVDEMPTISCSSFEHNNYLVIQNKMKKMETNKEKKSLIPLTLPKELEDLDFEIRKLTPRECFRIMDVDDADIDKIQATGLSKSAQYKLAGNSICVNVLYHLFRKMFIEKENESRQLNLFG